MSGRKRWTHLDQMVGEGAVGALPQPEAKPDPVDEAPSGLLALIEDQLLLDYIRYGDGTDRMHGILPAPAREVPSYPKGPETRQQRRARERRHAKR